MSSYINQERGSVPHLDCTGREVSTTSTPQRVIIYGKTSVLAVTGTNTTDCLEWKASYFRVSEADMN